jgi:hypothetical protein
VAERTGVLKIPNAALRFNPPEGSEYTRPGPDKIERSERLVYAVEADGRTLTPIVVRIGITDNVDTEILSGLDEESGVVISSAAVPPKGFFGRSPGK